MGGLLTFITWKWGDKYAGHYVTKLFNGISRHYPGSFNFIVFGDGRGDIPGHIDVRPIEDVDLLAVDDGCYARLRLFDPAWQRKHGIKELVSFDLDVVITGTLTPLFDRPEGFLILQGGHYNPCPYNGSIMLVRAGCAAHVWNSFQIAHAFKVARPSGEYRGTDQTWIANQMKGAPGWTFRDGVYAFRKPGWPKGSDRKPSDARVVCFPGRADPGQFLHLDWVKGNWR